MGPIHCPDTLVKDYHPTLRNTPEDHSSFITLYTAQFSCNCAKWCSSSLTPLCPAVRWHLTCNFSTQVCYWKPSSTTAVKLSQAVNHDEIGLKRNILETCCIYFIRVDRTGFSETLVLKPTLMELII
jgi:hypothetical protein